MRALQWGTQWGTNLETTIGCSCGTKDSNSTVKSYGLDRFRTCLCSICIGRKIDFTFNFSKGKKFNLYQSFILRRNVNEPNLSLNIMSPILKLFTEFGLKIESG